MSAKHQRIDSRRERLAVEREASAIITHEQMARYERQLYPCRKLLSFKKKLKKPKLIEKPFCTENSFNGIFQLVIMEAQEAGNFFIYILISICSGLLGERYFSVLLRFSGLQPSPPRPFKAQNRPRPWGSGFLLGCGRPDFKPVFLESETVSSAEFERHSCPYGRESVD